MAKFAVGDRVRVARLTTESNPRKASMVGYESTVSCIFEGDSFPYFLEGDNAWCYYDGELELVAPAKEGDN